MAKRGREEGVLVPQVVRRYTERDLRNLRTDVLDDLLYAAVLRYIDTSWLARYRIPSEARRRYFKKFYCDLLRDEVREHFILFTQMFGGSTFFDEFYLQKILVEYLRNNCFVGAYLTRTQNLAVYRSAAHENQYFILCIRNNRRHGSGENRRGLFVYTRHLPDTGGREDLLERYEEFIAGREWNEYLLDHDEEIVSVATGQHHGLFLDMRGRLYAFGQEPVFEDPGNDDIIDAYGRWSYSLVQYCRRPRVDQPDVADYVRIDTLTIVGIYCGRQSACFITDNNEIYAHGRVTSYGAELREFTRIEFAVSVSKLPVLPIVFVSAANIHHEIRIVDSDGNLYSTGLEEAEFEFKRSGDRRTVLYSPVAIIATRYNNNTGTVLYDNRGAKEIITHVDFNAEGDEPLIVTEGAVASLLKPLIVDGQLYEAVYISTGQKNKSQAFSFRTMAQYYEGDEQYDRVIRSHRCLTAFAFDETVCVLLANGDVCFMNLEPMEAVKPILEVMPRRDEWRQWRFECVKCGAPTNLVCKPRLVALCGRTEDCRVT